MINTIIALLLASSVSAFKPSKVVGIFPGLAVASMYDPKNFEFEDASTAKDAFPIEQGERRLQYSPEMACLLTQCYPSVCFSHSQQVRCEENCRKAGTPTGAPTTMPEPEPEPEYYCSGLCHNCLSGGSGNGGVPVVNGVCQDFCSNEGYCGVADVYKAGGTDCRMCGQYCSGSSGKSRSSTCDDACMDF